MSLIFARSFAETGGGAGRRPGGRKTGVMGKGKAHLRGGRGPEDFGEHAPGVLGMDADVPFRTHLLFPSRKDEGEMASGRPGGSPSLMKQMLSWGKKQSDSRSATAAAAQAAAAAGDRAADDPFFRGKQVSFLEGQPGGRSPFERPPPPERRPNSYHCDPPPGHAARCVPTTFVEPFRAPELLRAAAAPRDRNAKGSVGKGGVSTSTGRDAVASPAEGGAVSGLLAALGGQAAAAATGGKLTRSPACDPYASTNGTGPPRNGRGPQGRPPRSEPMPRDLHAVNKDCFIIPQGNLERFLPDGITLPKEARDAHNHPLLNILEVDDPRVSIVFHLMPRRPTRLLPQSPSQPDEDDDIIVVEEPPLVDGAESSAEAGGVARGPSGLFSRRRLSSSLEKQRAAAQAALDHAKETGANEGYLLKNLEKDSDYPFINYYVIARPREDADIFFRTTKARDAQLRRQRRGVDSMTLSAAAATAPAAALDLFEEVATIARPPLDPAASKRPVSDSTGYVLCVYRVFRGDDGEKFERNWLYWTGARMLYKNLPKAVGLRRITLHKSTSQSSSHVTYLLLVECTRFLEHIGEAANLLPVLRGRICGYTGIYRPTSAF